MGNESASGGPKPIRLVDPCTEGDAAFEQRDGERFCLRCQKTTHDLSEATRSEVAALMRANDGKVCARVRLWPSGEIRFRAEPPPRGLSRVGGAALALALAACEGSQDVTVTPEPAVAAPPSPSPSPSPSPGAPPVTEAPLPPSTAVDGIDHSTDASPNVEHHRHHAHQHPPAPVDDHPEYALGGLG